METDGLFLLVNLGWKVTNGLSDDNGDQMYSVEPFPAMPSDTTGQSEELSVVQGSLSQDLEHPASESCGRSQGNG